MKLFQIVVGVSFLLGSAIGFAGPQTPPEVKALEPLKKLAGTWEGKTKMHTDKEETTTVVYEVTSGGTAVVEKLGAGTPHEMVSVYHKDGNTISMTHYCMIGNAPQMQLKKADDKSMTFEMTKPLGITSMKEPHMHSVTLTFIDANTLKQEWTSYSNGKKADTAVFTFTRKAS